MIEVEVSDDAGNGTSWLRSPCWARGVRDVIVSVASGKGGTGKTTVACGLAGVLAATRDVGFIDADVEEPNAHILLKPVITSCQEVTVPVPRVDADRCTLCGHCVRVCAFGALIQGRDRIEVIPSLCHGCGGCALLCPERAIRELPRATGVIERGRAGRLQFAGGRLVPGEARTTPVIDAVKRMISGRMPVIIDSPPGTSCAMVASIRGSDLCLLVTEPTPLGVSDLGLAVSVADKLGIPVSVVINRCDIGNQADSYCRSHQIPVAARLPYDRRLAEACAHGESPLVNRFWRGQFQTLAGALLGGGVK